MYRVDLALNSIRDPEIRLEVADAFDRALRAKHSLRQTFLGSREPKFVGLLPLLCSLVPEPSVAAAGESTKALGEMRASGGNKRHGGVRRAHL